jgi:hypothetical protein
MQETWKELLDLLNRVRFPMLVVSVKKEGVKMRPTDLELKALINDNPTLSNTQIARLYAKATGCDTENARSRVRYYRGAYGKKQRRCLAGEPLVRVTVPPSQAKRLVVFDIPFDDFPVALGADAHIPYHDEVALGIFIEYCKDVKTILLLGDWLDMYSISSFVSDPTALSLPEEIEMMKEFLASLREMFPDKRIIYKIGNHEERLERYLMTYGVKLFGLDALSLPSLLGAEESRIEFVESRQMIKIGKLHAVHGHELGRSVFSPVNPARGLYLKAKKSAICAHHHQTSEHAEKNLDDKIESCWTVGCLCDMKPDYAPVNKWNHGFAIITQEDGMYTVHNKKIINGKVV